MMDKDNHSVDLRGAVLQEAMQRMHAVMKNENELAESTPEMLRARIADIEAQLAQSDRLCTRAYEELEAVGAGGVQRLQQSAPEHYGPLRDADAVYGQMLSVYSTQHGKKHLINNCLRCGAPVCCGKCCAEDTKAQSENARGIVARAIWVVLREYEDKCDLDLEDLASKHHVWDLADAAIAAQAAKGDAACTPAANTDTPPVPCR